MCRYYHNNYGCNTGGQQSPLRTAVHMTTRVSRGQQRDNCFITPNMTEHIQGCIYHYRLYYDVKFVKRKDAGNCTTRKPCRKCVRRTAVDIANSIDDTAFFKPFIPIVVINQIGVSSLAPDS